MVGHRFQLDFGPGWSQTKREINHRSLFYVGWLFLHWNVRFSKHIIMNRHLWEPFEMVLGTTVTPCNATCNTVCDSLQKFYHAWCVVCITVVLIGVAWHNFVTHGGTSGAPRWTQGGGKWAQPWSYFSTPSLIKIS